MSYTKRLTSSLLQLEPSFINIFALVRSVFAFLL